jgi:hypothetical protein
MLLSVIAEGKTAPSHYICLEGDDIFPEELYHDNITDRRHDKSEILDAALYMPYNDLCLMMQAREMSIGSFCNKSKYLGI